MQHWKIRTAEANLVEVSVPFKMVPGCWVRARVAARDVEMMHVPALDAVFMRDLGSSLERCFRLSQVQCVGRDHPALQGSLTLWAHGKSLQHVAVDYMRCGVESLLQARGTQQSVADVTAPMAGECVRLYKQEGDVVEAGETVLVLDAMKMENQINATFAGKIVRMLCAHKDRVTCGQKLFRLEKC
ncbi:MAG: hypothetical protein OXT67_11010 [Zetaproteobacteria bacterium]|nr:hypothetical protein [Zetaproteobacteria bacterium]